MRAKLQELQNAIYGNPELDETGQRSFLMDMGRLPISLDELMYNTTGDTNWMGPYYTTSFLGEENVPTDGFGNEVEYDPETDFKDNVTDSVGVVAMLEEAAESKVTLFI